MIFFNTYHMSLCTFLTKEFPKTTIYCIAFAKNKNIRKLYVLPWTTKWITVPRSPPITPIPHLPVTPTSLTTMRVLLPETDFLSYDDNGQWEKKNTFYIRNVSANEANFILRTAWVYVSGRCVHETWMFMFWCLCWAWVRDVEGSCAMWIHVHISLNVQYELHFCF